MFVVEIKYASPVWEAAAKSHMKKLESAQSIIARQITNSPWFIRNRYIDKDLKLKTIEEHFKKLSLNFLNKLENNNNPAIKEIPRYDPSHPRKKRRKKGHFSSQIKQDCRLRHSGRYTIQGRKLTSPFQSLRGRLAPSLDLSQRPRPVGRRTEVANTSAKIR
ncbi:hypothetical protein AVEN_113420-1 [Araneus ventricosus]|uniref:Uncharacterized protein n=1 Tax=Araneus ventricosus TaxID=182803 RepID=A0A4Y2KAI9_ARAVE|nr:hypothetical protein AVEN_113420-1 [Araneus ventricosus]